MVYNMDSIPSMELKYEWIMNYAEEVGVKPVEQFSSIIGFMVYDISNYDLSIFHVDAVCKMILYGGFWWDYLVLIRINDGIHTWFSSSFVELNGS